MAKIEKKGISGLLEEYNVSKVDIIIYFASGLLLILALGMFFYLKSDLQGRMQERDRKNRKYDTALGLKSNAEQIKIDFAGLKDRSAQLRTMFLEQKKMAEFVDFVRSLAKAYRSTDALAVSPTAMSVRDERYFNMPTEVYDYFFESGLFPNPAVPGENTTVRYKISFIKQQVRVGMELSLGNLLAFLYCLENSSKFMEVSNISLVGGDKNIIRVDMNIYAYLLNDGLKKRLKVISPGTETTPVEREEDKIRLLVRYPTVLPIVKDRVVEKEIVTLPDGTIMDIRPIFRTPGPPPPPPVACPQGLTVQVIIKDLVGFDYGGTTYFATLRTSPVVKTKKGKIIDGFPNLKLVSIDEKEGIVRLDNNGLPSILKIKKAGGQ